MNNVRVLCVENHLEDLNALKDVLETAGYEVVSATTASQGLSLLRRRPIDGVLVAYNLPDAPGSAVRAEMKRIRPEIPVLLFAGVGSQTPSLLRLFESYLQEAETRELAYLDFDA